MRFGSLFSGIGGLDLGLERAGMTVAWQSEIDPYCSRVLAKHWPTIPNLGDITRIDWSSVEPVDLICGGYPCQPFSLAGTRNGDADPRHLWPYFADAIRHLRPRFALLENVPGHLSLGFGRVLADLAALGYDTQWDCIPAAHVGAPHLRYRVFVVAHATGDTRRISNGNGEADVAHPALVGLQGGDDGVGGDRPPARDRRGQPARSGGGVAALADTHGTVGGSTGRAGEEVLEPGTIQRPRRRCSGDGDHWAVEPDVGRVADGVPHRVDRLRALGNAVVPQVAEWVGRRILRVAS